MEIIIDILGKLLWDLVKSAIMSFILAKIKSWYQERLA